MNLKRQIIDISYSLKLSHIGSCLTVVDLIDAVYALKRPFDKFVLSNGHSALALYCVLEKHKMGNAKALFLKHGVHPNKDEVIDCSTGSLGHGIGIAVGMAMADRGRKVYCIISDGECAEGSVWESLRIASELGLKNLKLLVNANGFSGAGDVDRELLLKRLQSFGWAIITPGEEISIEDCLQVELEENIPLAVFCETGVEHLPFLAGLEGHYHVLNDEEYEYAQRVL
jgi:transketolase